MTEEEGGVMRYNPKDGILIIGICSRTKDGSPGEPGYPTDCGIARFLSEGKSEFLRLKRSELKHSLKDILWGKTKFVSELAMNRNLVDGPDFAGNEEGRYLPALQRYQGKFYFQGLGGPTEAMRAVYGSGHHFLILSGLYGLVTPDEPLQLYTCPVEIESIEVQTFWRRIDALTRILIEYIQKSGIKRVFDLTARSIYRDLIDWEMVREQTGVEVLHCFSEEAAGDAALGDYGRFAREYLFPKTEEKLLRIAPDAPIVTDNGTFFLSSRPMPPDGYPREPLIVLPEGETEEDVRNMKTYINYKLDEFELNLIEYLKKKEKKHPDLIYALDIAHRDGDISRRKQADIRRKQYFKEHPMEKNAGLSLIDFLEYNDYRVLIEERWQYFRDEFGKKEVFVDNFERLRKLRNSIKHNNPVRPSEMRTGEGALLWFEDVLRSNR
jgi:hypothetical protein